MISIVFLFALAAMNLNGSELVLNPNAVEFKCGICAKVSNPFQKVPSPALKSLFEFFTPKNVFYFGLTRKENMLKLIKMIKIERGTPIGETHYYINLRTASFLPPQIAENFKKISYIPLPLFKMSMVGSESALQSLVTAECAVSFPLLKAFKHTGDSMRGPLKQGPVKLRCYQSIAYLQLCEYFFARYEANGSVFVHVLTASCSEWGDNNLQVIEDHGNDVVFIVYRGREPVTAKLEISGMICYFPNPSPPKLEYKEFVKSAELFPFFTDVAIVDTSGGKRAKYWDLHQCENRNFIHPQSLWPLWVKQKSTRTVAKYLNLKGSNLKRYLLDLFKKSS